MILVFIDGELRPGKELLGFPTVQRNHHAHVKDVEPLVLLWPSPPNRFMQSHYHRAVADYRYAELWIKDDVSFFPSCRVGNGYQVPEQFMGCIDQYFPSVVEFAIAPLESAGPIH